MPCALFNKDALSRKLKTGQDSTAINYEVQRGLIKIVLFTQNYNHFTVRLTPAYAVEDVYFCCRNNDYR